MMPTGTLPISVIMLSAGYRSASPTYGAIGPSFVNPKTGQIIGADITIEWFSWQRHAYF